MGIVLNTVFSEGLLVQRPSVSLMIGRLYPIPPRPIIEIFTIYLSYKLVTLECLITSKKHLFDSEIERKETITGAKETSET